MDERVGWAIPLAGIAWGISRLLQGGPSADPRTDYDAWATMVLSPWHPLVEMLLAATVVLAALGALAHSRRAAWAFAGASTLFLPLLGLLALGEPLVAGLGTAADAHTHVAALYLHPLFLALALGGLLALAAGGVLLALDAKRSGAPAWAWLGTALWPPLVLVGSSLPFAAQLVGPTLCVATGAALIRKRRRDAG